MNPLTWNAHLPDSKSLRTGFGSSFFSSPPELIGSDFRESSPEHRGFLQAQAEQFAGYGLRFFLAICNCLQLSLTVLKD